jgi:hypothetical protein
MDELRDAWRAKWKRVTLATILVVAAFAVNAMRREGLPLGPAIILAALLFVPWFLWHVIVEVGGALYENEKARDPHRSSRG